MMSAVHNTVRRIGRPLGWRRCQDVTLGSGRPTLVIGSEAGGFFGQRASPHGSSTRLGMGQGRGSNSGPAAMVRRPQAPHTAAGPGTAGELAESRFRLVQYRSQASDDGERRSHTQSQ